MQRSRYRSQVRQTLHYFARPGAGVPSRPVGGPAAFRAADLERSWIELGASEVEELLRAVHVSEQRCPRLSELRARDFPLPTLAPRMARLRRELRDGRGVVLLRGVPVQRWSAAACERFFWGFGLHLGMPGAQNPRGDLLGHVRDEGFDHQTDVRAYRTRTRIAMHCDLADVVGLLCLERAAHGGTSRIASSVAIHDEILRRRPDLLPLLYEPFALDTKGEGGVRFFPIAPCRYADGRLRTFYHSDYFRSAERHADAPTLTVAQRELLDLYDELANSDEFCVRMDLAPGDVQLVSNHTVVHGRDAYEDALDVESKRHLLRLWLSLPNESTLLPKLVPYAKLLGALARARIRETSVRART